jgi:hypothetical protein
MMTTNQPRDVAMKAFLFSCLLSTSIGIAAVPAELLNQIYGPEAMLQRSQQLAHLQTNNGQIVGPEGSNDFRPLPPIIAVPPPGEPFSTTLTPDDMRSIAREHVDNVNSAYDRVAELLNDARNRGDTVATTALNNLLNQLGVLRDEIELENDVVNRYLSRNDLFGAWLTLRSMESGRALELEREALSIDDRRRDRNDRTFPFDGEGSGIFGPPIGSIPVPPADGVGGGGAIGGVGGGAGGGGSIGGDASALVGIAAIAAAALAFSQDDNDEPPLASPFTTDGFSQAPEAGGEAPASANPQMLGD